MKKHTSVSPSIATAAMLLIGVVLAASCAHNEPSGPQGPPSGLEPQSASSAPAAIPEELWVIAKPTTTDATGVGAALSKAMRAGGPRAALAHGAPPTPGEASQHELGSGAMFANLPDFESAAGAKQMPLPLQHTAVNATIAGYVSSVQVNQRFENPFDAKIEAVYLFPLPEKAAVSEFLMVIGARTIRGILREKEEAEAIYHQARAQGHRASLLVQRRPNVFEQKVANIEPGNGIDVEITYFHTLAYKDGWYSFVFPTVVGPRYNPKGHPDPIAAVGRGGKTRDPGLTGAEYLAPGERSGHDLGITLNIDAGMVIEELKSTHEIVLTRDGPETANVRLAEQATLPNRDFVLDFRVAGETLKSNLLTYKDPKTDEGFFTLMVVPPMAAAAIPRRSMEMVFVIDCSGSMDGRPLAQAKEAINAALDRLNPDDTFQIIRFSDEASQFSRGPMKASRRNLAAARQYLSQLRSDGGTEMLQGIMAALQSPNSPSRLRYVSFMTDGYIGNESDILAAVRQHVGAARIFSFGVGSSVNRYLMERMAKEGRGVVAYLGLNDSAKDVMDAHFERVSHPALTDVEIDWGGMTVSDVYPSKLPDLFVGRPLVVVGKFQGGPDSPTVHGTVGDLRRQLTLDSGPRASRPFIAKLWARMNIADLADRQATHGDLRGMLRDAITRTALQHQLTSEYTSFVAVDSSQRTQGQQGVTVHQAIPVPDGVRYDTTVPASQRPEGPGR